MSAGARSLLVALALAVGLVAAPSLAGRGSRGIDVTRYSGTVNLNGATLRELDMLPGVGEKAALRILEHRKKKPFATVDELAGVKGFGKKRVAKLRALLTVQGPTTIRRAGQPNQAGRPEAGGPSRGGSTTSSVVSGRRLPGS